MLELASIRKIGKPEPTLMCTGEETAVAAKMSVTLAVKVYSPAATLLHVNTQLTGLVFGPTASPIFLSLAKNSTFARPASPSGSVTLAPSTILAPALKVAPSDGVTIEMAGGLFGGVSSFRYVSQACPSRGSIR